MNKTMLQLRTEAQAAGVKTFQPGRPCVQGHEGIYYVASGQCVDCAKHNARKVYQAMKQMRNEWEGRR